MKVKQPGRSGLLVSDLCLGTMLARLDRVSALPELYPYRMIAEYAARPTDVEP